MTQCSAGITASASPKPRRKLPRRVVTIRQAARFNAELALSAASPSGLVWREWNRVRAPADVMRATPQAARRNLNRVITLSD